MIKADATFHPAWQLEMLSRVNQQYNMTLIKNSTSSYTTTRTPNRPSWYPMLNVQYE